MATTYETVRGWGLGGLLAIIVLIVCIILGFLGKALEPWQVLTLIGMLALSRLT